jgi:hypothetical protein
MVAIATKMGDTRVWWIEYAADGAFRALAPMCELRGHALGGALDVSFSHDGRRAVTGGADGRWRVFDIGVRWRDGAFRFCMYWCAMLLLLLT